MEVRPAAPAPGAGGGCCGEGGCCAGCGRSWGWLWLGRSTGVRVSLVLLTLLCAAALVVDPANLFVLPILVGSPALVVFFAYHRRLRLSAEPAQDEAVARLFFAGCLPGSLLATAVEVLLSLLVGAITLGPQIAALAGEIARRQAADPDFEPGEGDLELKHDFGWFAYVTLSAFLVAAAVEESVKLALVRHAFCCQAPDAACCAQRTDPRPRVQAHTTVAALLAASLGFSFAENLVFAFAFAGSGTPLGWRVLFALARAGLATPVHAACAALTGLRLAMRDAQRRARDTALLAALAASGAPQFAMLPSGVAIQVGGGAPGEPPPPPAFPAGTTFAVMPGTHGGAVPGGAAAGAPPPPPPPAAASLLAPAFAHVVPVATASAGGALSAAGGAPAPLPRVWSIARVLWPAVLVHGSYDFVAMLLGDAVGTSDPATAVALTLLSAVLITYAALWALASQFAAAWPALVAGDAPPADFTCAPPVWSAGTRAAAAACCGADLPEAGWPGRPAPGGADAAAAAWAPRVVAGGTGGGIGGAPAAAAFGAGAAAARAPAAYAPPPAPFDDGGEAAGAGRGPPGNDVEDERGRLL